MGLVFICGQKFFRGDGLSRFFVLKPMYFVTKWAQISKLIFPHKFTFAPRGYVLTATWNDFVNLLRQCAQLFV